MDFTIFLKELLLFFFSILLANFSRNKILISKECYNNKTQHITDTKRTKDCELDCHFL